MKINFAKPVYIESITFTPTEVATLLWYLDAFNRSTARLGQDGEKILHTLDKLRDNLPKPTRV